MRTKWYNWPLRAASKYTTNFICKENQPDRQIFIVMEGPLLKRNIKKSNQHIHKKYVRELNSRKGNKNRLIFLKMCRFR